MKKLLIMFSLGSSIMFMSCSSKKESSGMSETAKKNLETNNIILKMFETGDWSKVGDYISQDVVDHAGPKGDMVGLDSLKAYFEKMSQMMTNMKNEIKKVLADDEYVMSWVYGSATAKVDIPEMGMKTGDIHSGNSVEVSRYKDGKVVEHWSFMDVNDMMKMMGGQEPMGDKTPPPPVKDSTSK